MACAAVIAGLEFLYRRTLVGRAFLAIAEDKFAAIEKQYREIDGLPDAESPVTYYVHPLSAGRGVQPTCG